MRILSAVLLPPNWISSNHIVVKKNSKKAFVDLCLISENIVGQSVSVGMEKCMSIFSTGFWQRISNLYHECHYAYHGLLLWCLRGHKPCGILVTAFSNLKCELCAKKVIFQQWCLGERLHSSTLWLGMRFIFYRTSPFGDPKNVLFMEVVACCSCW